MYHKYSEGEISNLSNFEIEKTDFIWEDLLSPFLTVKVILKIIKGFSTVEKLTKHCQKYFVLGF